MNTLVFDIGKTHVKLHMLSPILETLESVQTNNQPIFAPYPSANVDGIWQWFCSNTSTLCRNHEVAELCITTHGATAGIINRDRSDNGLVMPICDYEFSGVDEFNEDYRAHRPNFLESASPELPAGLNLGRQLYWQSRRYGAEFSAATDILMYPQYWVWRITGSLASEVTSFGCHTDLWLPWKKDFSSLAYQLGWTKYFPAFKAAHEIAGQPLHHVIAETGLPEDCRVRVGIHDSNASLYRYRHALPDRAFSLCSTGTWSIVFNGSTNLTQHKQDQDVLANVDLTGKPVVTSRFMGGREYALICEALGAKEDAIVTTKDIEALIDADVLCLPGWVPETGPWPSVQGRIEGVIPRQVEPSSLATLYCALMLDKQLDLVNSEADIIIEGAFLNSPLVLQLVAQLRGKQDVFASSETSAAIVGTALLNAFDQEALTPDLIKVLPSNIAQLVAYKTKWRDRIAEHIS